MEILAPLFFCHLWSGLYLQKVKDINRVRAMMFHLTVTNYVCINWIFVCGLRHEDSRDIVHLLDGSGYRTKGPPSRQWSEFMVKVKLDGNQLVFCQTYFVFWREFVLSYQCFYWNPQTFFWWTPPSLYIIWKKLRVSLIPVASSTWWRQLNLNYNDSVAQIEPKLFSCMVSIYSLER